MVNEWRRDGPDFEKKAEVVFRRGREPESRHVRQRQGATPHISWLHYEEACWDYAEPDTIRMEIGDCVVVIRGQNLEPLFQAIEEETLMRIRAQPELEQEGEREMDTFAVEIRFLRAAAIGGQQNGQFEFNLGR